MDMERGQGDCGANYKLNASGACPAMPICPAPVEPQVRRLGLGGPAPAQVAIAPLPTAEAQQAMQQHIQETVVAPVQEQQQVAAELQSDVDAQQHHIEDMQREQYQQTQKPIRTQEVQFARSIDPNLDNLHNPPCYLPQSGDDMPQKNQRTTMGPIGPWATGKVDWSPMAGLTGTRPVADRYSITRYSPNEWRIRNQQIVKEVNTALDNAEKNRFNCTTEFDRYSALVKKTYKETTDKVRLRVQLIGKWKNTLETAIKAMADEITSMERERIRLREVMVVLAGPESIAKECLENRSRRAETELVRDQTEEELVNELALIVEVRGLLRKTLEDFESQQVENRTARQRLEFDWSDKKEAYEIDTINLGLSSSSTTVMFRPGVVRQPPEQASEKYWEYFTQETLEEVEKCRQKSVALRNTLNAILMNAARDIRSQADLVEKTLTARINCTQEAVQRFENELHNVLQKLADTEQRIINLRERIRTFDISMKVAQSRMENRSYRPNVENCRDAAQQDLIDEVHTIQSSVTAMLDELSEAERIKNELTQTRGTLERELILKRRSLWTDRETCMKYRAFYPSANALSGNLKS